MFTISELREHIDSDCFDVLDANDNTITLQSKITDHCWQLLNRGYDNNSSVYIYHTNYSELEYRLQCFASDLKQALLFVKNFDSSIRKARYS